MGILNNIKGLVAKVKDKPVTSAILASQILNPITSIPTLFSAIAKKPEQTIKQAQTLNSLQGVAAGIAIGGYTKSPALGIGISGAGATISTLSALETSPKTSKLVKKAEELGFSSTKKLIKTAVDNPVAATTTLAALPLVGAAVIGGVKPLTNIFSGATNIDLKGDIKDLGQSKITDKPLSNEVIPNKTETPQQIQLTEQAPIYPRSDYTALPQGGQTEKLKTQTTSKKRKYKKVPQNIITQNVKVSLNNSSRSIGYQNKNYIKGVSYT